jgi:phage baseplate assembly protein W
VNLPAFGCGVQGLVFAPENDALATATGFLVRSSLQQWLGDEIQVDSVAVAAADSTLAITVSYQLRATLERRTVEMVR